MKIDYAYAADIVKSERDENGDLFVFGKATGPDLDLDEQVCDATWLKSAMPAWFEFGNVREMHQPIAAGVGVELTEEADGWYLKSRVVDESTAKKIESGALKGYSVGIKNAQIVKDATAPAGRISGGDIVEVSYVDRPCNPTAKTAICKAVGTTDLEPVEAEETKSAPITWDDIHGAINDAVSFQTAALVERFEELAKASKPAGKGNGKSGSGNGGGSGSGNDGSDSDDDDDVDDNVSGSADDGDADNGGKQGNGKKKPASASKTTDDDLVKQIEAAITKVSEGSEERIKSLEAKLTEVLSRPVPGGPVIAQTTVQAGQLSTADIEKAMRYRQLAETVTDPALKDSYRNAAKELESKH